VLSDVELVAKLLRGFGDPMRLAILDELAGGELRVTDLVRRLDGTQGNVSGHLQCLKSCGLVVDRPEGRQVFYRIARPEVVAVLQAASALLACSGIQVSLCPNYRVSR
jgi:DNA-binding transcriptional ArsR family regulator